ncbi:MAG TPA: hypothetical protein VNZ05_02810 [Solirubrobacteraceae bacterium]|jgi:hypothetical protein|nr:hypothetical protein [Solirubrobacteraceae bacterium]
MGARLRISPLVRALVAGGLIASGAPLLACGKSSSSQPRAHATAPGEHSAGSSPSPAQASAFARSVNLTAADVPGFAASSTHEGETAQEKRLEVRLRRCAGAVGSGDALAQQQSPSFKLRRDVLELTVSSEVTVARTQASAAGELAAIRSPRVRSCFSRYLYSLLRTQRNRDTHLSPVTIVSGTPPAPGANGSFGWRITASFSVAQAKLSLYVDILGFVRGTARVTLVSSGALRPFPAAIQQRLYTLLLARATAHGL